VFGQHVSPAVAEALVAGGAPGVGELRTVCVMFLDVRGFTRFAERRAPADVVQFLDTLFEPMIAIVGRHRGIINKFLGDGFMAVFGAPLPAELPARDAVAAAREILAGIERQIAAGVLPPTRVGIGLHAGEALTGTIGSAARKEYTIIGDVVNLAARIEQLTKQHDSRLLVSADVATALGETGLHTIGEVTVPGRDAPVKLIRLA
jgi:adenylate cyclase